jgi:hypothetical protein
MTSTVTVVKWWSMLSFATRSLSSELTQKEPMCPGTWELECLYHLRTQGLPYAAPSCLSVQWSNLQWTQLIRPSQCWGKPSLTSLLYNGWSLPPLPTHTCLLSFFPPSFFFLLVYSDQQFYNEGCITEKAQTTNSNNLDLSCGLACLSAQAPPQPTFDVSLCSRCSINRCQRNTGKMMNWKENLCIIQTPETGNVTKKTDSSIWEHFACMYIKCGVLPPVQYHLNYSFLMGEDTVYDSGWRSIKKEFIFNPSVVTW